MPRLTRRRRPRGGSLREGRGEGGVMRSPMGHRFYGRRTIANGGWLRIVSGTTLRIRSDRGPGAGLVLVRGIGPDVEPEGRGDRRGLRDVDDRAAQLDGRRVERRQVRA